MNDGRRLVCDDWVGSFVFGLVDDAGHTVIHTEPALAWQYRSLGFSLGGVFRLHLHCGVLSQVPSTHSIRT